MSKTITKTATWSLGLVESMRNPGLLVISNDKAVVIKDKYPKAIHHFLILPCESISSIYQFSQKHQSLLAEIELLATNVIELIGANAADFNIGYHASPSMQRVHLHVISRDYDSPCLKTKTHWNSYNTPFFRSMIDVHNEIRTKGQVQKPPDVLCKQLLSSELQCHRCPYKPKNMPDLKSHIVKPHK